MILFLKDVKEAFNIYRNLLSMLYYFQLTVACLTGSSHYQILYFANINLYVNFWNLITYNYARS